MPKREQKALVPSVFIHYAHPCMYQEIFDWLLLLGRWLHITVAMAWIGASIFFMWLDRTLEVNAESKKEGHVGDLWMVHGGGFYHVEKMLMGPTRVPEYLHWFKWESYWTWLSGIFLVTMIFYTGSGTFLLDSSVSSVTYGQALTIALGSVIVSWLFYDFLWERALTKNFPLVGHFFTLIWFGGMAYVLCHTLSGRAAYIHIGGMLGTWMTANVFLRIIPRQLKMVEASKRGEPVNQDWGKNAKNRSTHNTYFTLPVIFIMLSNHFPSTYGSRYNWVILLLVSAAGACIREYFISRLKKPTRSILFAAVGCALILGVIYSTSVAPVRAMAPVVAPHSTDASVPGAFDPAAGELIGVVRFTGAIPQGEKLQLPLACNPEHKDTNYSNEVIVTNGMLKNVLIRVVQGLEGKTFPHAPVEAVVLDQKNCLYEPRVLAARVGQRVEIVNSDPTFHNVKSITKKNEEFNIGMPTQNERITRIFTEPEIFLQTKCSVHPWMSAYIAVVEHPYFSVSNAAGEFKISGLPPGDYTIEAWHEVFGTQTKEIVLKAKESLKAEFVFKR